MCCKLTSALGQNVLGIVELYNSQRQKRLCCLPGAEKGFQTNGREGALRGYYQIKFHDDKRKKCLPKFYIQKNDTK